MRKAVIASVPPSLRHHLPQLLEEVLDEDVSIANCGIGNTERKEPLIAIGATHRMGEC